MAPGAAAAGAECLVTARPESWELAWEDVRAADGGARLGQSVAPGVFLVAATLDAAALSERLQRRGPFVRHLFSVHYRVSPGFAPAVWADAGKALAGRLDPALGAGLQLRWVGQGPLPPWVMDLRRTLDTALQQCGAPPGGPAPPQAISVVASEAGAWMGTSPTRHNLSPWSGGAAPAPRAGAVSRAASKLLEAFRVFDLPWPQSGRALDLGAAPGGWTGVLVERGLSVVAVDPAALAEPWAHHPHVAHHRETAEAYAQRPRAPGDSVQLLVNDMRLEAAYSARCMAMLSGRLQSGGLAVMTLKLHEVRRRRQVREAVRILESEYTVAGCRQLYHNRSEVTLALMRH